MGTLLDQTLTVTLTPPLRLMLQSLSNNDDDTENIGKKMNLYSFKLYHVYLDPLSLSNVSYVSRVWILRDLIRFKKRKESLLLYVHILHKISHSKEVSCHSRAVDRKNEKKCAKNHDPSAELLLCSQNQLLFVDFVAAVVVVVCTAATILYIRGTSETIAHAIQPLST